jgi:hypothetical protein
MQRGVKAYRYIMQRGVKSYRCKMQRGVKGKIPGNIAPLNDAAVRFHSPLHEAAGSQITRCMMQWAVNLAAGSQV